jgi:hypothetical protein
VQLFADEISTDNLSLCDDENGLLVLDHLFQQELLNVDDEMLGNESSFDDSDTYLDEAFQTTAQVMATLILTFQGGQDSRIHTFHFHPRFFSYFIAMYIIFQDPR